MAQQIILRRGTASAWTSANPTLAEGEVGFETDTVLFKIGNGATAWNSLAYVSASNIPIADSGSHFTATDVEGALAELFTSASSGKTSIASAIGSGEASASDSFSTLAGYITTDKGTMATNLTAKGVSAASSETLGALAAKINDISTGGGGAALPTITASAVAFSTALATAPTLQVSMSPTISAAAAIV